MKRFLLKIWYFLPLWLQRIGDAFLRPRYQAAVGAMIFNEKGQLLLCEHTYRRLYPWGLPGGDLKYGEDPAEGIKREVKEETGLMVGKTRLMLVENSFEIHQLTLTYLCTAVSGSFTPSDEVSSIRYFDTSNLPDFSKKHLVTISRCLEILNSGNETGI